jgi:DAK2 domain fusion protein YloV
LIQGFILRDAIISAANNIYNNRQKVDALNVFPVPDGDTGTNMSMSINAAKRELELLGDDVTVAAVAQTAASALLRGARGNSGVILSLLFRGFSKGLAGKRTAGAADIAHAMALGVESAYKAVMKPTEGTILTVSRAAAESMKTSVNKTVPDLWNVAMKAAADVLEKTPDMLPVLKKAGVVDAGGKGFVIVMEGMASVFDRGVIIGLRDRQAPEAAKETNIFADEHGFEGEITFTYCTEFLVLRGEEEKSPLLLRAFLETIGDCVVVVDDETIIKVHLHTDNPGRALEEALQYGALTGMKIENMREQYNKGVSDARIHANVKAEAKAVGLAYVPIDHERDYGFVAVAAGEGIKQLFLDLGVDNVVTGGQTMNPSTDEILSAVLATPAKTVFVLPNNKNIIMAAELTVKLADREVLVLPTKTVPQGLSAMLAFEPEAKKDDAFSAMAKAAETVHTGQITFAARDSEFDGRKIKKDQILAIEDSKLSFVASDPVKAAIRLTKSMLKKKNRNFLTILYGEGITAEEAQTVHKAVAAKYPDVETSVIHGGQPVYHFIISAE